MSDSTARSCRACSQGKPCDLHKRLLGRSSDSLESSETPAGSSPETTDDVIGDQVEDIPKVLHSPGGRTRSGPLQDGEKMPTWIWWLSGERSRPPTGGALRRRRARELRRSMNVRASKKARRSAPGEPGFLNSVFGKFTSRRQSGVSEHS